jgi:hypothetical protein
VPEGRAERIIALAGVLAILALGALTAREWMHYRHRATTGGPKASGILASYAPRTHARLPQSSARSPSSRLVRLTLVAARGDCWLEAHAGSANGKILYSGILVHGQTKQLTAQRLWIRAGRGEALDFRLNGGQARRFPAGTVAVVVDERGLRNAV